MESQITPNQKTEFLRRSSLGLAASPFWGEELESVVLEVGGMAVVYSERGRAFLCWDGSFR